MYKGYKRDKIEMRVDRVEVSDFPLYLNAVAGRSDCQNQNVSGFSFVVCTGQSFLLRFVRSIQSLYLASKGVNPPLYEWGLISYTTKIYIYLQLHPGRPH